MAEIGVDLSEAQDFSPIPDGAYEVLCNKKPDYFVAADTQLPCLKWEFDIVGNEGQEEFEGRKLWRNTPLSGKGAGFTLQLLQGLGVPYDATYENPSDENSKVTSIKFDDDHVLGQHAIATVSSREWTDKKSGKKKFGNDFELSPMAGAGDVVEEGAEQAAQQADRRFGAITGAGWCGLSAVAASGQPAPKAGCGGHQ